MEPSEPVNPYAPPSAELEIPQLVLQVPNLQDAREGRYDFRIGEVMEEAWTLVKGMKAPFWAAAAVIGLIYIVVDTMCGILFSMFVVGEQPTAFWNGFERGFMNVVMTPLTMGLQMMCVRRALGAPVTFSTAFSYLHRGGAAMRSVGLVLLMTLIGTALLVIPGIYLSVGYQLTTILICDQDMKAWRAMETSRRAIHHAWGRVLGLMLVAGIATFVSAFVLIPLIWTLPWFMMVYAVLYRRMFFSGPPPEMPAPYVSPAVPPLA